MRGEEEIGRQKRSVEQLQGGRHSSERPRNAYAGLTLKEYFQLGQSQQALQEIDEESCSSVSNGTPCFGGNLPKHNAREQAHFQRRAKMRTEIEEDLALAVECVPKTSTKMVTLSLEELGCWEKNAIRLPAIHEQRQKNLSRQGMIKEGKEIKEVKRDDHTPALALPKGSRLALPSKGRGRVTSSSFYQAVRDRARTEEEEGSLQKSFVITRYGGKQKRLQEEAFLRKQENSFKLTRH